MHRACDICRGPASRRTVFEALDFLVHWGRWRAHPRDFRCDRSPRLPQSLGEVERAALSVLARPEPSCPGLSASLLEIVPRTLGGRSGHPRSCYALGGTRWLRNVRRSPRSVGIGGNRACGRLRPWPHCSDAQAEAALFGGRARSGTLTCVHELQYEGAKEGVEGRQRCDTIRYTGS